MADARSGFKHQTDQSAGRDVRANAVFVHHDEGAIQHIQPPLSTNRMEDLSRIGIGRVGGSPGNGLPLIAHVSDVHCIPPPDRD